MPALYVILMLSIFVCAFFLQNTFNYRNNKQYVQMSSHDAFIKDWLQRNNRETLDKKKKKRRLSRYSKMSSSPEEKHQLTNFYKISREKLAQNSLRRSMTSLRSKKTIKKNPMIVLDKPSITKAVSEVPVIRVGYYGNYKQNENNDPYSSGDSSRTC